MTKKNKKVKKEEDITIRLLNDSRITSKHIELFNLAKYNYSNGNIDDPIFILDNLDNSLKKYNNYMNIILNKIKTENIDRDDSLQLINNSYTIYIRHILDISK